MLYNEKINALLAAELVHLESVKKVKMIAYHPVTRLKNRHNIINYIYNM